MVFTNTQTFIMIFAIAFGTICTRFLPFLLFPEHKQPPAFITYLSDVLPPTMMGLLVIYCLRDVNLLSGHYGIPEGLAILFIIIVHHYKQQVLLSIAGGTLVYMFLIQVIF